MPSRDHLGDIFTFYGHQLAFTRQTMCQKCRSARVCKTSEKKHPNDDNRISTRRKNVIPDSDMPIAKDSTVSLREAMGPVFKDTYAWIDKMNKKEERQFLLVAETFLGSQRVLSVTRQFGLRDWNCIEYFTQANQKFEQDMSTCGMDLFTLTQSKALISAKNMPATKHVNANLVDRNDWKNVEESVLFLMDSKCKGIRIDFEMQYDPIIETQDNEDDDEEEEVKIMEIHQPKKMSFVEKTFNCSIVPPQPI